MRCSNGDHGHGLGPCMLRNASYDFNDDVPSLGATYWLRLTGCASLAAPH
ncbi:hypothetical protein PQR53_22285 [Paraburkholderia fungorum]